MTPSPARWDSELAELREKAEAATKGPRVDPTTNPSVVLRLIQERDAPAAAAQLAIDALNEAISYDSRTTRLAQSQRDKWNNAWVGLVAALQQDREGEGT